jgi:hypothetical protein
MGYESGEIHIIPRTLTFNRDLKESSRLNRLPSHLPIRAISYCGRRETRYVGKWPHVGTCLCTANETRCSELEGEDAYLHGGVPLGGDFQVADLGRLGGSSE